MKKEDIITLPNPHLRQKSQKIHVITPATIKLIDDMVAASLDWEASRPHEISAALAAVQIDRLERVVVVRADFDDKENREFVALINPEIVKYEGTPTIISPEGCLSVSGRLYGEVPRYPRVRVRALNIKGETIRLKATGFLSMLLQHEIDHTNGITFVDHIRDVRDAFYVLDENGELTPAAYDTMIKDNPALWPPDHK